jgi:hypothetical protein
MREHSVSALYARTIPNPQWDVRGPKSDVRLGVCVLTRAGRGRNPDSAINDPRSAIEGTEDRSPMTEVRARDRVGDAGGARFRDPQLDSENADKGSGLQSALGERDVAREHSAIRNLDPAIRDHRSALGEHAVCANTR